ncbi:MAG: ABC transporter permease subunit [Aquimonas sp.]
MGETCQKAEGEGSQQDRGPASHSQTPRVVGAASALGMTYAQSMRLIILPQAFRKMTPLLLQQSIILFQDTSLVYTVGLMDFLNAARSRGDILGQPHEFLIFAGLMYFTLSFAASQLVKLLQKRLAV